MIARSAALRRGFAVAVAAALVTSGCAAGRDAQTANQVSTEDGTTASVGLMALRGISLEAPRGAFYGPGSAIRVRLVLVNTGIKKDSLTNIVTSVARGWGSYPSSSVADQAIAEQTSSTTPGTSGPSASSTPGTSSSSAPVTGSSGSTSAGASSSSSSPTAPATTSAAVPPAETAVAVPPGQRVSFGVPDSKRVLTLLSSVGRVYPGSSIRVTFTFARAGSVSVRVPVQLSSDPGDNTISPAASGD